MLKKILLITILMFQQLDANAANLLEVYQQALCSDPKFQQTVAHTLVTKDNVPISIASILPHLFIFSNPTLSRYGYSGTEYNTGSIGNINFFDPRNLTQRTYELSLNISQPVFDFRLFANIGIQLANAKSAYATLNAALQDLMIRVSEAYFAILRDEEDITYTNASKRYYSFQLQQVTDQYEAGVKMLTDVYTARAAYESSVAAYIAANKKLMNDKENLKAMTGVDYCHFSYLKNNLPFLSPQPNNKKCWIDIVLSQNWSIKAAQYSLSAARQNIKQEFAGHLPVISLQGNLTRYYTFNINRYPSYVDANGAGTITERSIGLNVTIPLFEGGGVTAKTDQAKHLYEQQYQILEETIRNAINNASQSFMNILAGISQINADKYIISATMKSLEGTIDRYQSGIETLIDVLNREENLYAAQLTYAADRYELVNNVLILKEAAGTLSFEDLRTVNSWLVEENQVKPQQDELLRKSEAVIQNNKNQIKKIKQQALQHNPIIKNQVDVSLNNVISQIKEESRENFKKQEDKNRKLQEEIITLKTLLSELKKDLQNKDAHLNVRKQA